MLSRDDEDVHWRLRMNVSKGVTLVVLVDGRGGNASFNDFAEETAHDEISVQEGAERALNKL